MSDDSCDQCGRPRIDPIYARYRALEAELTAMKKEHALCHKGWGPPEGVVDNWAAQLKKAEAEVAALKAEVKKLRIVHDWGWCEEHDSWLGGSEPLGCLVPFGDELAAKPSPPPAPETPAETPEESAELAWRDGADEADMKRRRESPAKRTEG